MNTRWRMSLMEVAVQLYDALNAMVSNIESGEVVVAWADTSGCAGINHGAAKAALGQARPLLAAALAGRSPETEAESDQEWHELTAKQAREGL